MHDNPLLTRLTAPGSFLQQSGGFFVFGMCLQNSPPNLLGLGYFSLLVSHGTQGRQQIGIVRLLRQSYIQFGQCIGSLAKPG